MITERDKTISIVGNRVKLDANNIFDLEEIQQMQDLFSNATGVASIITYPNGVPITKPSNFCRLCNDIIRKTEKGCSNCFKSDAAIGRHNLTGPVLQPCLSGGLWDAGVSITIGNKHIANWLIGQVRTPDMDEQQMLEYAVEIGVDKKEFLEALREVPIMPVDQFKKVSDMLFVYANGFSEKIYKSIQLEKQIAAREKINQALLKSEEALSITLHSIGDGVISTDKNGLVVDMNPVAENLCGWKLSEAKEKPLNWIFNIINAESRKKVDNPVDKVLESGKVIGLANHTVLISRDGSEYHISDSAAPIKNSAGEISGVVLVFSDITDQYRAEADLIESERSKSVLLANLPGTAYRCKFDRMWTKEFISKGCVELTGYQVSDFINNNTISFDQLILPEYRDYLWGVWENAARNKETVRVEYKIRTADNQIKWVWEQGIPILNKDGEIEAIEGIILDISERKQIEEALKQSEEKYRRILENVQDVFYQVNMDGNLFEISPSIKQFAEYEPDEIIGSSIERLYACVADRQKAYVNLLKSTQLDDYEVELITKSGDIRYASLNAKLFLDSNGNPDHIDGFIRDVTTRKLAEEELKQSEIFLKETQLIANLGNCIVDFVSGTWKSSEIFDTILGIESEYEKTFEGFNKLVHPDWRNVLRDYFIVEVLGNTTKFDKKFKIIRPVDKEERWIHGIGELKLNEESQPKKMIITIQDITEQKKSAEALQQSEDLYRSILLTSPDAIVVVGMDGRVRMASPAALSLYGCNTEDQLRGINMFDVIFPEDRERAKSNTLLMPQGYMGAIEYRIFRSTGEVFLSEVSGDVIWDTDGNPTGMVFIIRDITQRKRTESALKSSQEQLKKFASHLQSVREEERILLAREIHDELGQILIAIKIDLGMLKQKTLKSIKKAEAENILTIFDNIFGLVDNTIKTTRKIMTDLRPEVLYLLGFTEAVKLHVAKFQERHQINCYFENSVKDLELNMQQSVALFRILQESLTNVARHSKANSLKVNLLKKEDKLIFQICDNGIGMSENSRNKQDSYGLIGMRERVFLLDGELSIISELGNGTTIQVEMPCGGAKEEICC